MLQQLHEMIEPCTKLGLCLLQRVTLAFRLDHALAPRFQAVALFGLVLAARQRSAQHLTLIFWHHIGEPASLTLNHRDDHIDPVVILKTLTNGEKITLESTFDAH
jgi:hypothetical protein